MMVDVVTYYLEMRSPDELRPPRRRPAEPPLVVRRAERQGAVNRDFYERVGAAWHWTDRLVWTADEWQQYADDPAIQTGIGYCGDAAVGYFELDARAAADVELAYFGLLPEWIGRGQGGLLLAAAVELAWSLRPERVWVHTCTLDHASALANYTARGFRIYRQQRGQRHLAAPAPRPAQ